MDQNCPKCGMINPASARYCDYGYDFVAMHVDRQHVQKRETFFVRHRSFVAAGIVVVLIGIIIGIISLTCIFSFLSQGGAR